MKTELELRTDLQTMAIDIIVASNNLDAENPTKVGMRKLRKLTLEMEKLGKEYRKASINKEKGE